MCDDHYELLDQVDEAREIIEGLVVKFAGWNDSVRGFTTGGLSELEDAFKFLGWEDPHPAPEHCCKQKE